MTLFTHHFVQASQDISSLNSRIDQRAILREGAVLFKVDHDFGFVWS